MAESCDLILKGSIVVNQDGEASRDLGIRVGSFAATGDLSLARLPAKRAIAAVCICCRV